MLTRPIALAVSLVAALFAGASAAARAAPDEIVVVAHVEGTINASMVAMVQRAVDLATEENAARILVEIDSPGGAIEAMDQIGKLLDRSTVRPVAYVRGNALSAAAYVALCCEGIYTGPRSEIGSATPIFVIPGIGLVPTDKIDKNINEKMLSEVRAKFRARAQEHTRPGLDALASAMVDPDIEVLFVQLNDEQRPMTRTEFEDLKRQQANVRILRTVNPSGKLLNLTATEAFDLGLSDGMVESREELLTAIGLDGAGSLEVYTSWSERFFGGIGDYAWLLWGLALLLLFIEFKTPGFGFFGITGLALVALLLTRNHMVGLAELPEILLVVLGVVLLAIELLVIPGFGVTGILGIACIAVGIVFSFLPFVRPSNAFETDLLNETLRNFLLSIVVAPIGGWLLFRYGLRRLPFYRGMVLEGASPGQVAGSAASLGPLQGMFGAAIEGAAVRIGDRGTAVSVLRPAGKVEIDGRLLHARSAGDYIEEGERVEVVELAANHVVVRSVAEGPPR